MASQRPGFPLLLALTLALPVSLAAQEVHQSPRYVIAPEGGSVNIACSSNSSLKGVFLIRDWPTADDAKVIHYSEGKVPTVDELFRMRVNFSGSQQNLTITVHHLQPTDTGIYTCQAVLDDIVSGSGTLVLVTGRRAESHQKDRWRAFSLFVALAVGCFLAGLGLGVVCALRRTQIKKLCSRRNQSTAIVVYEDMSCSRHNTLSVPNHYH
ncbi:T-cell antigen CD7 [Orycteropus afer afer]|uniref:T-cell antigen CD7 n=1 Tax=Orycteropus afer afer TaxID=1230840 RepID=A0AC54ZGG7_ORYAF|nr:T-cell antigen CD7 [Orycteropus afer afer]